MFCLGCLRQITANFLTHSKRVLPRDIWVEAVLVNGQSTDHRGHGHPKQQRSEVQVSKAIVAR